MKVLLVVNSYSPHITATSSIVQNLANFLASEHEVSVLCLKTKYGTKKHDISDNVKVLRLFDPTFVDSNYLRDLMADNVFFLRKYARYIVIKFFRVVFMLQTRVSNTNISRTRVKIYEKYFNQNKNEYDFIVSFSADMANSLALSKTNTKSIRALYQLDPYSDNHVLSSRYYNNRLKLEKFIYMKMDVVYVHPVIYKYNKDVIDKNSKRFELLEFPKIIYNKVFFINNRYMNKNVRILVYTGLLYKDIRNPDYAMTVLAQLDINFKLYMIGTGFETELENYREIFGDRLIIIDRLSFEDTQHMISNSDFLINIGNSVPNQVPSKLFEYISTGKPIINFQSSADCSTISYLKSYKNAISIDKNIDIKDAAKILNIFCEKNHIQQDFYQIKTKYKSCTVDFVGKKIIKSYEKIKGEL